MYLDPSSNEYPLGLFVTKMYRDSLKTLSKATVVLKLDIIIKAVDTIIKQDKSTETINLISNIYT